jgi:hypothetical protein
MYFMTLLLVCFGLPVLLMLFGAGWLWLGLKFVCYVFTGG